MRYAILVLFLLFSTGTAAQEKSQSAANKKASAFKITTDGKKVFICYAGTDRNHPYVGIVGPRADLSNAELHGAHLGMVSLIRANLINANLVGCDLKDADFTQANLESAILTGADLSNADLSGANISNAVLKKIKYRADNLVEINDAESYIASYKRPSKLGLPDSIEKLKKLKEEVQELKDEHGKDTITWDGAWYYKDAPPILPKDFSDELKNKLKVVKRKENDTEEF